MATDTFLPWKDYANAIGVGLLSMMVFVLIFMYTPAGSLPDPVVDKGPLIIGLAVAVAYVMVYSNRNF